MCIFIYLAFGALGGFPRLKACLEALPDSHPSAVGLKRPFSFCGWSNGLTWDSDWRIHAGEKPCSCCFCKSRVPPIKWLWTTTRPLGNLTGRSCSRLHKSFSQSESEGAHPGRCPLPAVSERKLCRTASCSRRCSRDVGSDLYPDPAKEVTQSHVHQPNDVDAREGGNI